MSLKRKAAAVLAAAAVVSSMSAFAYAESGYFYDFYAEVGVSNVMTTDEALKKEDNLSAAVTVYSEIPSGVHVTFRVRDYDGAYATRPVDVEVKDKSHKMSYLSGKAVVDDYYRLATSLDSGQGVESVCVDGKWEP